MRRELLLDSGPARRQSRGTRIGAAGPGDGAKYVDTNHSSWSASGLAAVWAEENTREAICDAFRRKETFATSGPRIRVRFFAGYDFPDGLERESDAVARAYVAGVPMGVVVADLVRPAPGEAPESD